MKGFFNFNILLGFTLVLCAFATASSVPLQMNGNTEAILEYLQLDADSQIELVEIKLSKGLRKRSLSEETTLDGTQMYLRAFGRDVHLWLHPRDEILANDETPVYSSHSASGSTKNATLVKIDIKGKLGILFEDHKYSASIVIGKDDHNETTANGLIEAENLCIRSFPRQGDNDHTTNRFSNTMNHVVYKINAEPEKYSSNGAIHTLKLRENMTRTNFTVPNILYPKILVVADFSMYKGLGSRVFGMLEYIVAFWNGVDLRYRAFQAPRIRLHIFAIIIAMDDKALSYISDSMKDNVTFDWTKTMVTAGPFFYRLRNVMPLERYDIAITMTRLLMEDGTATNRLGGRAYTGSICHPDEERRYSVMLVRDVNPFQAVSMACHELAHSLGIDHDPATGDCKYDNGFIMAPTLFNGINSSTFSECSLRQFQKRLLNNELTCIYSKPQTDGETMPVLIGNRFFTLDEQCSILGWQGGCDGDNEDICSSIPCLWYGVCQKVNWTAVDGTPCTVTNDTSERHCMFSRCVCT